MRRIYKYQIQDDGKGSSYVMMPPGAKIHHVGMQDSCIMLWAEVDSEELNSMRSLEIVGTGHDMPKGFIYIGTVHQPNVNGGEFVWHICEVEI